jgi:hypothetical protein
VTPPRPDALRLVARAGAKGRSKPPRPPFGLAAWSPTADAIAVLLDAGAADDPRTIAGVAAQLPHASTLPSGTAVFVLGKATAARAFWRLLARDLPVPRASRCTALLAKGYVDIGADDVNADDLAWGLAP